MDSPSNNRCGSLRIRGSLGLEMFLEVNLWRPHSVVLLCLLPVPARMEARSYVITLSPS